MNKLIFSAKNRSKFWYIYKINPFWSYNQQIASILIQVEQVSDQFAIVWEDDRQGYKRVSCLDII